MNTFQPKQKLQDRLSVPKNSLMLIAGLVWLMAGFMVMKTGWPYFLVLINERSWMIALSAVVFVVFYLLIFSKTVKKHTCRIQQNPLARIPFWQFFDRTSYIIMAVMMSGGMALRNYHLVPGFFIGFFYEGLGFALFACGTRFISVFLRKAVLLSQEPCGKH